MLIASTNRVRIDTDADSATLTMTASGGEVALSGEVASDEDGFYIDVLADEVPELYSEVILDWRLTRIEDWTNQVRTVRLYDWVLDFETEPAYAEYRATGGSVPPESWRRYHAAADSLVETMTMGRSAEVTSESDIEAVEKAVCAAADALYAADTGVVSERLANYSVQYSGRYTRSDAEAAVLRALSGTGLTYRGL